MQLNGSQIFVEVLCEQGVDTLFGYPGGAVLNLYDELYKNADRITHVLTAHEQGASHAADATPVQRAAPAWCWPPAARAQRTSSPASPPLYGLCADGGFHRQCDHGGPGQGRLPGSYIEGITMPITKHNFTVRRVEDLADTMRAAFRIAQSGRKGPVLVDIPKDITAASCEFTPKLRAHPHRDRYN